MDSAVSSACPRCGRTTVDGARMCGLCGSLLRVDAPSEPAATGTPSIPVDPVEAALAERARLERGAARHAPWGYFALGLATAPVFALTPILQYMGWFLASLVHEMGHAACAWACGMPAFPAISPAGHAAAVHGEQSTALALCVLAGLLLGAWRLLEGRARVVALVVVAIVQPTLAFTHTKDLVFLLSGHGGELAFATLALWKTLDGGFTSSKLERALYGTVGWYLAGKNVFLCVGLMTSAGSRAHYASNGSFGMTNDYIRAAEDVLGWRLETVALWMLVASVATIPAAIALWRARLVGPRLARGA